MKIIKKVLLIFIGIILSFVILEIGLQIAGFSITTIKKYKNKITKDPNIVTILCLGESTTDNQWPTILQKILDKKSKNKKFNVIDEGLGGTNTRKIAEKLSDKLIEYNPDIVITMMGINDYGLGYKQYKLKTLSLFSLILSHIRQWFYYTYEDIEYLDRTSPEISLDELLKITYKLYKKTGFIYFNLTSRLITHIINKNENYDYNDKKIIDLIDKLLNIQKQIKSYALYDVINYFKIVKHYNKEQIKEFLINNKDKIEYAKNLTEQILEEYDLLYLLNDIKNNKFVEPNYKNLKKSNNLNQVNTKKNYEYIIFKIHKNNKKTLVMPMQYPTWSIEQLKNDLKDSPYFDKLIFISNEENFKQVLQNHKKEEIFLDMFAGDFGHCTDLGNTLIAENVAETILKLYN